MSELNLLDDWKELSLSQLGSFSKGKGITKADLLNEGLPCIRYGEIYTNHHHSVRRFHSFISTYVANNSRKLKFNDLLFAGSGETLEEIGKAVSYRLKQEAFAGSDIVILSLKDQYRADYIAYYLNSLGRNQINRLGAGHSVVHVYSSDLAKVFVILPPTVIQERIVDMLEQWDAAIEKTEALITAKKRQFKWLVTRLLDNKSNSLNFDKYTFGDIFFSFKEVNKTKIDLEVLSVTKNGIVSQSEYFIKEVASKDKSKYLFARRGSLVMSGLNFWMGSIDFQDIRDIGIVSPAYKTFKVNSGNFDERYLRFFVRSKYMRKILMGASVQGASVVRRNLDMDILVNSAIHLPPLPKQQAIAHTLNTAQEEINLLKKLNHQYRTQKRGLMQKLLTGQWQIKNKEVR